MKLEIPKRSYSLKSIRDTIYWFSNDYTIILDQNDHNVIISRDKVDENFSRNFMKTLNDYSLRDLIQNETKEIKNLVTAKAFYPDLVNFKPIGEFDDPLNIELRDNETK